MKYVGSKSKISKDIVPIIQKYIDDNEISTYIEPFVGGANVIDKINCKYRFGSDIDTIPISLLTKCVDNPNLLDTLPEMVSREYYYEVKYNKDKFEDWYYSAILLFGSYNNRVYGGCYGAMATTKEGQIRNYFQESIRNFKKQIPRLKDIVFENKAYYETNAKNCLIYCDPPYAHSIKYSQPFDNEKFWQWCRNMSKDNIVIISEYSAPEDFVCIWEKEIKVHIRNNKKNMATERLFVYKGDKHEKKNTCV